MTTRVLIVDDDSNNRYMLETILKGYGFEVVSATNGREALDQARLAPPDLIVTDILMPVMDGYTLCREWKSDDQLKWIPLIFYTATYTESKDEKFALSLSADRFVEKPQEPDVLISIIREVLSENYEARQAPAKPLGEEMEFFRQHNKALFSKLEKKMVDLEVANQKLSKLEEHYRLSFENASDVIYTIDTDLTITSMSPSIKKILGYAPEDLVGRNIADLTNIFNRETLEEVISNITMVLKGEKIFSPAYEFIARDGVRKFCDINSAPIIDNGNVTGVVSIARDVTSRKQSEKALHEAFMKSQELEFIINHSPAVAWLWKAEPGWPVEYVSDNISIYGYTPDDFISGEVSYSSIIHPDDLSRAGEEVEHYTKAGKKEFSQEYRIFSRSGNIHWIDDRTWIRRGSNGSITHYQGISLDVTEYKQADEALKEARRRIDDIIDFLPDATFAIDLEGTVIAWNRAMEQLTGVPTTEILGKGNYEYAIPLYGERRPILIDLILMRDDDFEKRHYEDVQREGNTLRADAYMPMLNEGKGATIWGTAAKLFDVSGNIVGAIESIRDITEQRKNQRHLQETLERLRNAVETTIQVMVSAVEARDPYTAGHQLRVADLVHAIAREMNLPEEKIDSIRMAASIHDIGKLSVPAEILAKPTHLSDNEFSLVKEHPRSGYEILKDVETEYPLAEIVYQHHERLDGSGYPRGLKGEEILLEARIIAVADVVEAMASHRPHRPTLGIEAAIDEITRNKGILYDPDVVDTCLVLLNGKGYKL